MFHFISMLMGQWANIIFTLFLYVVLNYQFNTVIIFDITVQINKSLQSLRVIDVMFKNIYNN